MMQWVTTLDFLTLQALTKVNNMKQFLEGIILGLIAFGIPTLIYAMKVGAL